MRKAAGQVVRSAFRAVGLEIRRKRYETNIPSPAPELPMHLLDGCCLLPTRHHLVSMLPTGGVVAEIGVAGGDFSAEILQRNAPAKLYLIDAWAETRYASDFDRVKRRFNQEIRSGRVSIERGSSIEVLKHLSKNSLDWIYIDTVHDYETTRQELELALRCVKSTGFITGHDYCTGNAHAALPYGVIRAVHEFCLASCWAFAYLTLDPDGHQSFCLAKHQGHS